MTAGEEMTDAVEHVLANPSKQTLVYSGMEYGFIEESRKQQMKACQTLRDKGWRIHACAFSMLHYEADFLIRATLHATDAEEQYHQKEYDEWKTYKERYGRIFE